MTSKELTVSCSCGAAKHTFSVPTSSLPLPSQLCNCDISRRISGSLITSYVNITHSVSAPKPDTSHLTAYDSSGTLRRWFCSTCGTHMYLEYHSDGHFEAATGTLQVERSDEIVRFESMMWIGDTRDGGGSEFVREIEGKMLKRYMQEACQSEEVPSDWQSRTSTAPAKEAKEEKLKSDKKEEEAIYAHCHCRVVEFWITPPSIPYPSPFPSHSPSQTSSPFPDLTHPHHLNLPTASNPSNIPWWQPSPTHWLAGTCMCPSCRRASGFDITFWAFIPTSHIFLDSALTTPMPSDNTYWGSIKTYASSPGVTRSFCSKCGANVFWHGDEERFGRRGLVDVAVGLLDAGSGARAEEVLSWWRGRVSFGERAVHEGLKRGLEAGLKGYEVRRAGLDL